MKKRIKTIIWLAVALSALVFLAYRTPAAEFKEAIAAIHWPWLVCAVLIYLLAQTLLAPRWILLLRVHGVEISMFQTVKLTYLGLFYNNMMPGAVGGDLLKAWYITHHSEKDQRVEAAVTVFVDRLVGLIGTIILGVIASFIIGGKLIIPVMGHKIQVRWLVWAIFLSMVLFSVVFFSRRIRRMLLLKKLLEKLPFARQLHKIDQAIQLYRRHKQAVFLSLLLTIVIQGLSILTVWMLSQSLELKNVSFVHCLIIMPIIWQVSVAIPVPGGLGIMENLFVQFFSSAIDPAGMISPEKVITQAAALAFLNRLMICLCSLPGCLVPIFGGHLPKSSEMERELE